MASVVCKSPGYVLYGVLCGRWFFISSSDCVNLQAVGTQLHIASMSSFTDGRFE